MNATAAPAAAQERVSARAELQLLDQWVIYNSVSDKKPRRFDAEADKILLASHSNPAHWTSYAEAIYIATLRKAGGIGFVFHESDPYSGIDLDGCRDPETEAIEQWAQRIIDRANSYTEISPSGTGVKIFVRGTLPRSVTKSLGPHKGIEIYSARRYFTFTGQHLTGTPTEIRDAQQALDDLLIELTPVAEPTPAQPARKISLGEQGAERLAKSTTAIDAINRTNDLEAYLIGRGATKRGRLLSCCCGRHAHGDRNPSLQVCTSRDGVQCAVGSAPCCLFYHGNNNGKGKKWDYVAVVAALEHKSYTDIVREHSTPYPARPRQRRQDAPTPAAAPEYILSPEEQASRAAHNATRRAQRAADNRLVLDTWRAHLATLEIPDRAHLLGDYLYSIAQNSLQVRPTNTQIAEALHLSERTIVYAFRDLEAAAMGKRHGGRGGLDQPNEAATWSFNRFAIPRVQAAAAPQEDYVNLCTLVDHDLDLELTIGACEGAPVPPPEQTCDPSDLDCWSWADAAHGACDLDGLVEPDAPVVEPVVEAAGRSQAPVAAERATAPDRDLLGQVRALARTTAEPGWFLRDYDALDTAALQSELARLEALQATAAAPAEVAEAPDGPGASYDPARDWTAGGVVDQLAIAVGDLAEPEPLTKSFMRKGMCSAKRGMVNAADRYAADVALKDTAWLSGEAKKLRNTIAKFQAEHWVSKPGGPRAKLVLVQKELARRSRDLLNETKPHARPGARVPHAHTAATEAPIAPRSQAPARPSAPHRAIEQVSLFALGGGP
jgi:hypothetical protein